MEGETMNHTSDATADSGGNFDPEQAAALLGHTTQRARRQLAPSPPWLLATRAVAVLAVCGAVWLNVRGQHPYHGPTRAVIPVLVAFIVLNFAATVAVRERALAGVRGSTRLRTAEITVMVVAWASVPVLILALAAAGQSLAKYPTTVLIVPGLAWAAVMAARAGWRSCSTGLAVAVVGVVGAFAGPAGAWAVAGVGLCAVLLAKAAAVAWRQRRPVSRP
jgi:hypothetical protein